MAKARYIILKTPLNVRDSVSGEVELSPGMTTVHDLINELLYLSKMKGSPDWYVVHGQQVGRVINRNELLIADELYIICPSVEGIELAVLIAGLVLSAATVGYSIYSYMDMKSSVSDMLNQDPTRDDGSASQSYSYATKENYRTDNVPIPIVYGKTKVGGVVINELQYGPEQGESESYKTHIALCEGPIDGIAGSSDIFLNDSMLSEFSNWTYSLSSGVAAPSASTHFPALYQQHFPANDMTNTLCLWFPFTASSSTLVEHACANKSGMHELGTPNNDTPTYNAAASVSISTSVVHGGYSTASLRLSTSVFSYLRYADNFENFFRPGGDPFNIEWWFYFASTDVAKWTTNVDNMIMYHTCGDTAAAGGRQWEISAYSSNSTAVYFNFKVITYTADSTVMRIRSVIQQSTALDDAWHHYRVCRDGEFARIYIDGEDVTDLSTSRTFVSDDSDVYARNGTNYFYFGGLTALNGYLSDVRMDSGGNVAYDNFASPAWVGWELSTRALITSKSRGYADGLMWQYRWLGGCFDSGSSGQSYNREGSLFQEKIETSGDDIYRYDDNLTGAGHSSALLYECVETWGKNNSQLIRQQELPFTRIKVNNSLFGWTPNERVLGAASGHFGDLAGYSYDGTEHSLYLRNPTGTFTTGESVSQITGASATVTTSLSAHTTYDAFITRKVSPSWNHSYHKNANELKSVTEVRAFTDVDPVNGRQLIYPHTACLSLNVRAQKGLTSIPKVNTIITGIDSKTLYRWDSTNAAPSSIGAKNMRNPAWATWDLMTDGFWHNGTAYSRGYSAGTYEGYGLGISPKYLDYVSFAEWSSYCTATVDGVSRCLCNISLDEKDKTLWDSIESIAMVGRGRLVPVGNKWYAKTNEKVDSPVMVVGGALIESGSYEEEYIEDSERYDEINIEFLNEENKYIKDTVGHATDDWDDPTTYDIMKTETVFIKGITNPDQAKREAILRLQQVQSTKKRVRFVMDVDAINFEIGDVIKVQHSSNKYSHTGVCSEKGYDDVGLGYIILDHEITLESAIYSRSSSIGKIAWRQQDADTWTEMNVQGPFDTVTTLIITTANPDISIGDPVFIGRSDTAATASDFDLIRVEEINVMGDQKVEIIGFNYDETVYTHTDYGTTAI